jgi:hypothetical protein
MDGFTVTRHGRTSSHLAHNGGTRKARTFDQYGAAEDYLRNQIERLQRDGYRIEYRRTMEQHRTELINDTAKTDAIWTVKAERGVRPGRGIVFIMRPTTDA